MLIVLFLIVAGFLVYVEVVNRHSRNMSYRQKLLKAVYPLWMWYGKLRGKNSTILAEHKTSNISFYSLKATLNNGSSFDFETLKGKKVLLVNTASNCGYTDQYDDLEKLSNRFKDRLVILAFPSNDFREQEKGSDREIEEFCRKNYGISFPLMHKVIVKKLPGQEQVYQWLTDSTKNGWNTKAPSWNFCKYLVDEKGMLVNYFGSSVSPLSKQVVGAVE